VIAAGWAALADALAIGPGIRILDVGCGGGGFCALAAGRGARVSGIDADPGAVARARERMPDADIRMGFMEALPWADGSFDAVVACNAFQYALDIDLALREATRVLRAGGCLGVCSWGQDSDLFRLAVAVGAGRPGALRVRDPVEAAVGRAGLRVSERGDVPVELEVPDEGALAGAIGIVHAAPLREHAQPHRRPDGSYRFSATVTYLIVAE
jgi:SAM-dependent methyltransferase